MIQYQIEAVNLRQVNAKLAGLGSGLASLKPLWERFSQEFYRQETRLFEKAPWKPLSPAYAQQKAKRFPGKPLLRATDTLFRSLTQQGAQGNVHRVNDGEAEFGSSDPKAMRHFMGTSRMPARDPLAEPDIQPYNTIAGQHVAEMLKNAGFN